MRAFFDSGAARSFEEGPHPDPLPAYRERGKCDGLLQILRFNWPFYATASLLIALALSAVAIAPLPAQAHWFIRAALALPLFWIVASIFVSHWVYDRSPLMHWRWIIDALDGVVPRSWVNIHSGLDESTPVLRTMFSRSNWRVLDIFDAREMTEASVRRARALMRNATTPEPADYAHLPVADASVDAIFLLLAAHELRTVPARDAFFAELRRAVAPGGSIVLAEHLRDHPNFFAFGPGAFHFHSRGTWLDAISRAGFIVRREFRITPFVRVFVLRRPS